MTSTPLISVITVSLNQGEFIRDNIESVLRQNYPNFEHIVIDGGSTDGTLEILRSYPHLKWISEKDRNQSHALNKGFSRAKGDIIAWLNSDDWYADGVFSRIVPAIRESAVVMTPAVETNRTGIIKQEVENTPRLFHDLLRYWIPYAWVAQNGIFFTRELLEKVKYGPEVYVDEDLNFCMDYDLWLRMARICPFTKHLSQVGAYFRVYEDNKTGKSGLAVQKEFSRVYRRHLQRLCDAERALSVLLVVDHLADDIKTTLQSITAQELRDFELILVDALADSAQSEQLRVIADTLQQATNVLGIRYMKGRAGSLSASLNAVLPKIHAPVGALVLTGDEVTPDFTRQVINVSSVDPLGLALPLKGYPEQTALLYDPATQRPKLSALFSDLELPFAFIFRTEALRELGGMSESLPPGLALQQLICRVLWKGWHVSVSNEVAMKARALPEGELKPDLLDALKARILVDLYKEAESDPFGKVRVKYGWMPVLEADQVRRAEALVSQSVINFA